MQVARHFVICDINQQPLPVATRFISANTVQVFGQAGRVCRAGVVVLALAFFSDQLAMELKFHDEATPFTCWGHQQINFFVAFQVHVVAFPMDVGLVNACTSGQRVKEGIP